MEGSSRICKFVKSNLRRVHDVDLLGLFLRISLTTSFELRAVDRSVFCHLAPRPAPPAPQSPSHNLRRHRSPSRRPARGCVSFFFCVLRDEHLSIDLSVFAWPACSFCCWLRRLYRCYTCSRRIINLTSTGWRRWWARPLNALASGCPSRAPSPPSPT